MSSKNKCRHFNGLQHERCEAGVRYDDLDADRRVPYRAALPCLQRDDFEKDILKKKGVEPATCGKCSYYTQEELDERERETERLIEKTITARDHIVGWIAYSKQRQGVIDCPVCGNKRALSYSQASNGHISASCLTDDCVQWME